TGDGMEVPDYGVYKDQPWPGTEKGQAAMITRMDADVGRLVALLRELDIDRKTLILFTSDNGPHSEGGHKHEYFDANGPLRGFKRDLYEGGIRVPTIAWWPGVVPPGSTSNEPLAFYDFLPTACELAGVKAPEHTDGISFLPTLQGRSQEQSHHEYLYWKFGNKEAVRMGTWKAVRLAADQPIELYDLARDVGESENIAEKHPDVIDQMEAIMRRAVE
ncbi:MAG TPA: sulfatase-like hydrolase/transferase, partial [Thermoguttaceae bacterium]|nr:sulfatase-like hydrolase/transferase [Thermoguttaceae bacterium]